MDETLLNYGVQIEKLHGRISALEQRVEVTTNMVTALATRLKQVLPVPQPPETDEMRERVRRERESIVAFISYRAMGIKYADRAAYEAWSSMAALLARGEDLARSGEIM